MAKINDNLGKIFAKLASERSQRRLHDRFPGRYRAEVVETNDPLNMNRVRFKMPELHNFNLKPEDCPWAVPSFEHGGKGCGSWTSPCIGDIIWISFEKQHPYGPVWVGHAEPTRRRFYKLHALYQKTQIYVDKEGKPESEDTIPWDPDYYPKDGRPYSQGLRDRYGNMFVMDMTGFYPIEHKEKSAPTGIDALTEGKFKELSNTPEKNEPDLKMMAWISKYGHYFIIGDQGYKWDEEFEGDHEKDHEKEKKRINNLKKLLNEDEPKSEERDQRRVELRTDYGHKFEMRDVGWASDGGYAAKSGKIQSKSRADDLFEKENKKSEFDKRDERWIKLRSKGGMMFQMMDMGIHPQEDSFIRRKRIDEVGGKVDDEDNDWQDRDARQIRFVTRWGIKMVLDDRGSDEIDADQKESKHANGFLVKGRRWGHWSKYLSNADNEEVKGRTIPMVSISQPAYTAKFGETPNQTGGRGFGIDINEKNELNRLIMYSPMSKAIEMNDRFGYLMLTTDAKKAISKEWKYKRENEFTTVFCIAASDPEMNAYSMKLDRSNTYAILRTPTDQAFEARDGWNQNDEAFIEMRDVDNRGLVLSKQLKLSAMRDPNSLKYLVLDDEQFRLLLHNKQGKLQIYAIGDVEIISDANIRFSCPGEFTVNCTRHVINAGGGQHIVDRNTHGSTVDLHVPRSFAFHVGCSPGLGSPKASPIGGIAPSVTADTPPLLVPKFRQFRGNETLTEVNENVIIGEEQI